MSGRAGYEPRCEWAHEANDWHQLAEVLLHVFELLVESPFLVLKEALALLGVHPIAEEASRLRSRKGVNWDGADPDCPHQCVGEGVIGHAAGRAARDEQRFSDRLLTGDGPGEGNSCIRGMEKLESGVGAELEHDAGVLCLQVDRRHSGEPQDAPAQPRLPDGVLTRRLVAPVFVSRTHGCVDTQRRLAVLTSPKMPTDDA